VSIPIVNAVLLITGIALISGLLLGYAHRRMPADSESLVEKVNDLLPQTQCAQCGYTGCKPYAAAIIDQDESINLCPPGGQETVDKLADLLGLDGLPLAEETPSQMHHSLAFIDEELCIGCTHCRDACPVDAIVGAPQLMHTIISSECTGCELCLPPCPVDCISMVPNA
jgi:H+/Na+-translocating ferredoxin:NAD+ oxidoreductase subunit B